MELDQLANQMREELKQAEEALAEREKTLDDLRTKVERLKGALSAMEGRVPIHTLTSYAAQRRAEGAGQRVRREMSPEAKERIREAQRKRWAKQRGEGHQTAEVKPEETKPVSHEDGARQTPLVRPKAKPEVVKAH